MRLEIEAWVVNSFSAVRRKLLSLTPEGLKVLDYAEQMMATMQGLKQSLETTSSKVGRIRIGVMMRSWASSARDA